MSLYTLCGQNDHQCKHYSNIQYGGLAAIVIRLPARRVTPLSDSVSSLFLWLCDFGIHWQKFQETLELQET